MPNDPPPPVHPPSDEPGVLTDAQWSEVAAGEASASLAARVHTLAAHDPALAARLEAAVALEGRLHADTLLPVPVGLVARISAGLPHAFRGGSFEGDSFEGGSFEDGAFPSGPSLAGSSSAGPPALETVRGRRFLSLRAAAAAVLALGAGVAGLGTVAGSGVQDALPTALRHPIQVRSIDALAAGVAATLGSAADRATGAEPGGVTSEGGAPTPSRAAPSWATTGWSADSIVRASRALPGSPAFLGAGAFAALSAAVGALVRRSRRGAGRPALPGSDPASPAERTS